jgi:hypothetical protein
MQAWSELVNTYVSSVDHSDLFTQAKYMEFCMDCSKSRGSSEMSNNDFKTKCDQRPWPKYFIPMQEYTCKYDLKS